jgi:glycosyltransferase involved in cell wall biosynthesis
MKANEIDISVIIPAYNEELYIGRCLKSLFNQDYVGKYEVVVVNNASSDATGEVAEKEGARVVFEPNKGIANALIRGVAEAKGNILLFTDADTELPPNWILTMASKFEEDPELAAIGGPYDFYDAKKAINLIARRVVAPAFKMMSDKFMPCSNMAIRRDMYEKTGGFDPKINWGQDMDISRKLSKYGKVRFDTSIIVSTSFRRYSGGHPRGPKRAAHFAKEAVTQLTRYYMVSKKGKVYRECQEEIRESERMI